MADSTVKFVQLLKPLRVLADNWDVDIATELTEYADVVDRLTQRQQSLNNTQSSQFGVNFAHAALLIQNSASIYSRKVQYLYNLTQETHEFILHKRVSDDTSGEQTNGHPSRRKNTDANAISDTFECLDTNLSQKDASMSLDESAEKCTLLTRYTFGASGACSQRIELFNDRKESIGYKDAYDMLTSSVNSRGLLVMCTFLAADFDNRLHPYTLDVVTDVMPSPVDNNFEADLGPVQYEEMVNETDEQPQAFIEVPIVDDNFEADSDSEQNQSQEVTEEPVQQSFWTLADPHSVRSNCSTCKVFKKGAFSRAGKIIDARIKASSTGPALSVTVQVFLREVTHHSSASRILPRDELRRIFLGGMQEIYQARRQQLDKFKRRENKKSEVAPVKLSQLIDVPESMRYNDDNHMNDPSSEVGGQEEFYDNLIDDLPAEEEADINATDEQTDLHEIQPTVTMDDYLLAATQYEMQVESLLSKRVRNWESSLGPVLLEQELRTPYDIHAYGEMVMDKLNKSCAASENNSVALTKLANGVQKFDVSRYFLALLHLAADGVVNVIPNGTSSEIMIEKL